MNNGISRREAIGASIAAMAAVGISAMARGAEPMGGGGAIAAAHDRLAGYMKDLVAAATTRTEKGVTLLMPCVSATYRGIWPDDCIYPYMAMPGLAKKEEMQGVVNFLTESLIDMQQVPDRVEADGLPVMSPGGTNGAPMTDRMALHLPAAWTRYLDYCQGMGVEIPKKKQWARLIARSFEKVPFSCGLAYADPQRPPIGFGFHDSIKITGFELMSSLMLYRGLQRAGTLFAGEIEPEMIARWKEMSERIAANLYRCYDEKLGSFVGGTRRGRQVSVWASGLMYSMVDGAMKQKIVGFYKENQAKIFLLGCTRQIASPSWENAGGESYRYQNGGFWATGTGYVLPAIADQDPQWAGRLATELAENLPKIDHAEWLDNKGKPSGAMKFLASVSVPLLGLRSVMEKRPLIEYF